MAPTLSECFNKAMIEMHKWMKCQGLTVRGTDCNSIGTSKSIFQGKCANCLLHQQSVKSADFKFQCQHCKNYSYDGPSRKFVSECCKEKLLCRKCYRHTLDKGRCNFCGLHSNKTEETLMKEYNDMVHVDEAFEDD